MLKMSARSFLKLYGHFAVVLLFLFLSIIIEKFNSYLDLEENEKLSEKQFPTSFEEMSKYQQKKLSKYHLKIVESSIF